MGGAVREGARLGLAQLRQRVHQKRQLHDGAGCAWRAVLSQHELVVLLGVGTQKRQEVGEVAPMPLVSEFEVEHPSVEGEHVFNIETRYPHV